MRARARAFLYMVGNGYILYLTYSKMRVVGGNMATLDDVYRIKAEFVHPTGQIAQLYFDYRVNTAGSAAAPEVRTAFVSKFQTQYNGLLNENSNWAVTQVINGMNNSDFVEVAATTNGARTGSPIPAALTTLFRCPRAVPADVPALRRLPFGSQSDLGGSNGDWSATFQSALGVFAALLNDELFAVGGDVLTPVQLTGGFKLGVAPTVKRALTASWEYASEAGWLESRQPAYAWVV